MIMINFLQEVLQYKMRKLVLILLWDAHLYKQSDKWMDHQKFLLKMPILRLLMQQKLIHMEL